MHVPPRLLGPLAAALLLAACGGGSTEPAASGGDPDTPVGTEAPDAGGAAGACLEGTEDCVDADLSGGGAPPPDLPADIDVDAARQDAASLLGEPEDEVLERWSDVRLGRRGDETFALTEDHQPGRRTIATEDDGSGTYRVVEVVLELPQGTETFTAE